MKEQQFYVIVFESTHSAIAAEEILKKKNYKIDIIPTPREITASCGLSIKFNHELLEKVTKEMSHEEISIKGIYQIKRGNDRKIVEKVN